jgi:3-oxoacyl-[acyl-carrier-protein] synthase-3
MAVDAGARAVKDSGVAPTEIDTVIVATCTMPTPIPNAAAQTAERIGIPAPGAFDLNAACAGFCFGMSTAADLVRGGSSKYALVIGAEKLSDWLDWTDRSTAIIFADGAGAAVIGPAPDPDSVGIGPVAWGSAGDMSLAIQIKPDDQYLAQEGQAVFRWATTKIAPVALRAIELAGLAPSDIDALVPHQANCASSTRWPGACGPRAPARTWWSPTTSCTRATPPRRRSRWPWTTCARTGGLRSGDTVLLVGFGAGLSYAAQVVTFP